MNFDLNIDNYSRDELIQMFELPSNFDKNILELKETKMRDSIINNKNINKNTQSNTLIFLSKTSAPSFVPLTAFLILSKLSTMFCTNASLKFKL